MTVDPRSSYDTTWWEYVRDTNGGLEYRDLGNGVSSPVMRRIDTGEVRISRDLPIGALWTVAEEYAEHYPKGRDGLAIMCRLAEQSTWQIDGRASNCTMKNDNEHRCWVRQGTVGDRLTIDKNGPTCGAGAGSFFMGRNNEWHGFLRNGKMAP